ncbi:MAG: peptidoglycan-binding protein [Acidimicrobiia bacterium]|nr:peptidoglycan-binding protein [Acidimicrobiia bacterium]
MALYRRGDTGQPVRDIQDRLVALDLDIGDDAPGEFGPGTEAAVISFQEDRRLTPDGMVGRETWRTLVDAGFRMGDRLLYYRLPMLHGDDVSTLQSDLNALGFDAGIVDGIFGPDTLRAVIDFQQNRRMAEDGVVGPKVVEELALMVRATKKVGRDTVRERVWMSTLPSSLAGQRVFLDPFCRDEHEADLAWDAATAAMTALHDHGAHPVLSRSVDTAPAERLRARHANEIAADLVVGFSLPRTDDPGVFYFASPLSHSEAGQAIAGTVARRLGLDPVGRVTPMLRETRAPAVVVAVPRLDAPLGRLVVRALADWFTATSEG